MSRLEALIWAIYQGLAGVHIQSRMVACLLVYFMGDLIGHCCRPIDWPGQVTMSLPIWNQRYTEKDSRKVCLT